MMISKKRADQEEHKKKKQDQPTDNKEATHNRTAGGGGQDKEAAGTGTEEKEIASAVEQETAPDKLIQGKEELAEKLAEMQDKYLRLSAEFDNYRKRTLREKIDLSKYAGETILKGILPFMDDFERALRHMDTTDNTSAVKEGINLIYQKLTDFLKTNGVKEIDCENGAFNVDLHEAVGMVPAGKEEKKGKVVEVVMKGYYLNDKVIRHSRVLIGE